MKIGELVKTNMIRIIEMGILRNDDIKELMDEQYSKKVFNINYAVLKEFKYDISISEQRNVNNYPRYYAKCYLILGKQYLLCNDWYNENRSYFTSWLKKLE